MGSLGERQNGDQLKGDGRLALYSLSPKILRDASKSLPHYDSAPIPPYFWGQSNFTERRDGVFPTHQGYAEARDILQGNGSLEILDDLTNKALAYLETVFEGVNEPESSSSSRLARIHLSDDLLAWRDEQYRAGRTLPSKGLGLQKASDEVLRRMGVENWPESLITNDALFGCGMANFLIGAYDPQTLFSNYVADMAFYYEHGYHKVFPEFEELIQESTGDAHAMKTLGGPERRAATHMGMRYIRGKVELETKLKAKLGHRSAKMDRRTAQIMSLSEGSLLGLLAECIARGFDPAAVMTDLNFASPGTDAVDVGCDINNSEVMNSFLNTADITDTGIVSEEALRRVYDAYAYTGGRTLTSRWAEPMARMNAALYAWHIVNDRHMFLRRALLGYSKARKAAPGAPLAQREADWDEVFDESFHTTGFSRPLEGACDGGDPCNAVSHFIEENDFSPLLSKTWWHLVTGPLAYVAEGVVDAHKEEELVESLRLIMADCYSQGMVLELTWLAAHACHHAWQVNHIMEAAMFGSLLDSGKLAGRLDRTE